MNIKIKLVIGAVVVLAVGFIVGRLFNSSQALPAGGASGTKLAENYDPYIRVNGGFYSALPVQTTNTLTSAAFTATGDATVSGGTLNVTTADTATSTLVVGCIQFYATSTATALKFQASTTPGVMYSQYGTCPNL
ncbi:MAG: hypothetical protein KGI66_02555 [Patescibacteria group bacterium]|nr:hypothetical protein [Patescibacteria group bacterium]